MKSKFYLIPLISVLTATAVLADDTATPQPTAPTAPPDAATTQPAVPAAPAPAEAKPKPARKKKTTRSAKTTKATESSGGNMVFNPPATAKVKQEAVNVRGQASFIGEVITHLKKGETVTVLEEIALKKPKKDEPAKWAKILMPTNTPVWVSG